MVETTQKMQHRTVRLAQLGFTKVVPAASVRLTPTLA